MKRNLFAGRPRGGGFSLNVFTEAEMDDIHFATLEVLDQQLLSIALQAARLQLELQALLLEAGGRDGRGLVDAPESNEGQPTGDEGQREEDQRAPRAPRRRFRWLPPSELA